MATLTIPQITLAVGSRTFGPGNAADAEASITLTIDRTVTGGLNSLTGASVLDIAVDQSNDGGTTWHNLAGAEWTGGIQLDKHGNTRTQEQLFTTLNPGTSRKVRASTTVSGTSIAIAGTVVTA